IGDGSSEASFLKQLASRKEAGGVYYPPCGFVKTYYETRRGGGIVNPLQPRGALWSPTLLIKDQNDFPCPAGAFFSGRKADMHQTEAFFLNASRDIFARLLEYKPSPQRLVGI